MDDDIHQMIPCCVKAVEIVIQGKSDIGDRPSAGGTFKSCLGKTFHGQSSDVQ